MSPRPLAHKSSGWTIITFLACFSPTLMTMVWKQWTLLTSQGALLTYWQARTPSFRFAQLPPSLLCLRRAWWVQSHLRIPDDFRQGTGLCWDGVISMADRISVAKVIQPSQTPDQATNGKRFQNYHTQNSTHLVSVNEYTEQSYARATWSVSKFGSPAPKTQSYIIIGRPPPPPPSWITQMKAKKKKKKTCTLSGVGKCLSGEKRNSVLLGF